MPRPRVRSATFIVTLAALAGVLLCAAGNASAQTPAEQLISTYSPVTMLRSQEEGPCDPFEEQFRPTTVDVMLGNPAVRLDQDTPMGLVPITDAPTAKQIAGLGEDYYLNVPGDPLEAGSAEDPGDAACRYASDFQTLEREGRAPPITYAHIATEAGRSGLVVQYWFFYYFNQFNDLHEGDWEGMQVAFDDANSPAEALADGPSQVALFQHAGGERAGWDDDKVQKDGTHPIVFPAAGSHATFYDDAVYIENGQGGSGVGCDNTTSPLTRVVPTPETLPTKPKRGSPYVWLNYLGHWGEKQQGFNNGPQGPVTKSQWLEPFTWMDGIREGSPRLPSGASVGPTITNAFCGAVASASDLLNLNQKSPLGAAAVILAILLLIAVPPFLTRWRPVEPDNLHMRRRLGQILRASRQLYGRHWRTLLLIGLTSLPIIFALEGLEWLLAQVFGGRNFDISVGPQEFHVKVTGSIQTFAHPIGFAVVSAAVIAFIHQLDQGKVAGFRDAYRECADRFWRVVLGQLAATTLLYLLVLIVIGLPFAIYYYIAWQFIQQEIIFRNCSIREAFRGSRDLVRGRWWRTVRVAGVLWLLSIIPVPILGFALLFTTVPPVWADVLGSLVFALLVPYVAIGRTLLYFDLQVSQQEEGAGAPKRRRRLLSRLRPSPQTG